MAADGARAIAGDRTVLPPVISQGDTEHIIDRGCHAEPGPGTVVDTDLPLQRRRGRAADGDQELSALPLGEGEIGGLSGEDWGHGCGTDRQGGDLTGGCASTVRGN